VSRYQTNKFRTLSLGKLRDTGIRLDLPIAVYDAQFTKYDVRSLPYKKDTRGRVVNEVRSGVVAGASCDDCEGEHEGGGKGLE